MGVRSQKKELEMELSRGNQQGEGGKIEIVLDLVHEKFTTQDGHAFLQYKLKPTTTPKGKQVMEIQHTYVPNFMRGLGVAGVLCQAAFTHASECNLLVLPTCSYVSGTFLPRSPEWNDVLVPQALNSSL